MNQKFKKGDRVKVIVGHILWSNKEDDKAGKFLGQNDSGYYYDMSPELTEDTATVEYTYGEMSEIEPEKYSPGEDGYKKYSLKFDKYGSISWFDEQHIEQLNEQQYEIS